MSRFEQKVALVTGGSRGIGKAICLGLAAEGVQVGVNYCRNQDKAEAVAATINENGGHAIALGGDLGKEAGCERHGDHYCAEDDCR